MFDVTVKTLDGRDSVLTVDDEIKVEEFKSEIESKLDIPVAQQRLIFQGRVLPDNTRLIDYGVKDKVVHLVPRPPPTQGDGQSAPPSTGVTNSTSTFGQLPLGGWDMRQTIQDITAGIFSGLGEFGRSIHIPIRANSDQSASSPASTSALVFRERTFNRLYRQASHILRRISHTPLSPTFEASVERNSTCSEENGSSATVVNQAVIEEKSSNRDTVSDTSEVSTDSTSHINMEPSTKLPLVHSPMAVDQESSRASAADDDESAVSGNCQLTPASSTHPIAVIASMLSRQRQLWRSIEPYLDQWETMLNAESLSQQGSSSPQTNCSDSQPSANVSQDSTQTHATQSLGTVDELSVPGTTMVRQGPDSTHSEWHHRFFVQVSRLLHLHAHMLHLISDFNVISVTSPQSNVTTSGTVASSDVTGTTLHNATAESPPTSEVASGSESKAAISRNEEQRSNNRRVVQLPETEGHWIRTRINVEPVNSAVRPSPTIPTSQPLTHTIVRGRPTLQDSADHRRSQSTSNLDRNRNLPGVQGSDQVHGAPAVSTSVHSGPFVTGGTAIIHRVDIPIISMNMINLPVSTLEHLSAPSNAVTGHTGPPLITSSAADSSQPNVVDHQASETNRRNTERPTTTATGSSEQSTQSLPTGPTDPFLVCHSRHFAHEHHHRIVVPFVPHSAAQFIPTSISAPPPPPSTTQDSTSGITSDASRSVPTSAQPPASVPEAEVPTTPSAVNAPHSDSSRIIQSSLSQQIASFISSATNVVTSAAAHGGFDLRPFNVLLSSPPIQLTSAVDVPSAVTSDPNANSSATVPGPWQSFSWMFGRENPFSSSEPNSSQPAATVRPDSRQAQSPVLTTPSWGRGTSESQLMVLTGSNRILNVFIEALIETIWSRLSRLATADGDYSNAFFSVWNGSQSVLTSDQEISVGLLTDTLTVARNMLSSNSSDDVSPSSLDAMRIHLRHLIDYADSLLTNKDRLAETIVELIFGGNTSDETLSPDSSEARAISSIRKRCEGGDNNLIDVRASFVRLFKANLSAQIELWRTSPTNYGFGSTLLWTIADFCVDCFCLVDLIFSQLAKTSGLLTVSATLDGMECRSLPDSGEFHILIDRLNAFAETLSHSQPDAQFVRFVLAGVNRCIDRYSSMDQKSMSRRWDHLSQACIVRRRLTTPSLMDVDSTQNQLSADDTDMDDLPFVDASSDLVAVESHSVASGSTQQRGSVDAHDSVPDSCQLNRNGLTIAFSSGEVSSLPEWSQVPNGPIESWTDGLRRHPNSVHPVPVLSPHLSPEGWHAVLPGDWINVVASDIETMNRSQSLTGVTDKCFSDAYIAGMPAKRRKVMQEHSRSLAQPPKTFLADCLSDAIRSSGCDRSSASDGSPQPGLRSNSTHDPKEDAPSKVRSDVSDTDLQLVLCLRELVSERIEARLLSDPDFDPTRFPMSSKTFMKKHSPKD